MARDRRMGRMKLLVMYRPAYTARNCGEGGGPGRDGPAGGQLEGGQAACYAGTCACCQQHGRSWRATHMAAPTLGGSDTDDWPRPAAVGAGARNCCRAPASLLASQPAAPSSQPPRPPGSLPAASLRPPPLAPPDRKHTLRAPPLLEPHDRRFAVGHGWILHTTRPPHTCGHSPFSSGEAAYRFTTVIQLMASSTPAFRLESTP
jgi:hypothetical protein